jgi:hypothetical protein
MPAKATAARRKPQVGSATPRVAPPLPARSSVKDIQTLAERVGYSLYPWQLTAARYLTARGPLTWQWREVAVIVARQNGKTLLLEMLVLSRLLAGQRIMHTAQNLKVPRITHRNLAAIISADFPELLASKRSIRYGSGQEDIRLKNGGYYHIVAATQGSARGHTSDLVVVDEVHHLKDFDFLGAAKPTINASKDGQIVYASNAGTPESVVLNSLHSRADNDPNLAYLEWSMAPDDSPDNVNGWLNSNPSIGHNPALLANLEAEYRANLLGESMDLWEREYLCRWTNATGRPPLILMDEWERQDFALSDAPRRATMGIKVDPSGERASAVMAWPHGENCALEVVANVTGNPIDITRLGPDLAALAVKLKARRVIFDPTTDADLIRYFRFSEPITGAKYAQASEKFVQLALHRQLVVRDPAGILAHDLLNTVRASNFKNGTYLAVKSSPETTNTAVEAAIRAAWFASAPQPKVMVY